MNKIFLPALFAFPAVNAATYSLCSSQVNLATTNDNLLTSEQNVRRVFGTAGLVSVGVGSYMLMGGIVVYQVVSLLCILCAYISIS